MERAIYENMAEHDNKHWWYCARRRILAAYITRCAHLPVNAKILEVGCGTGHNLEMLSHFGHVDAAEMDDQSRRIASRRLGRLVHNATLPSLAGIDRGAYDLVAVLDVIEHVDNDVDALKALAQCLRPGGKILITVPAHAWLWSGHDVSNHHYRRYSRITLAKSLEEAGLTSDRLRYFNSLLFLPALVHRLVRNLKEDNRSHDSPPPAAINFMFEAIFSLEAHAIGRLQLPIGVSLATLASPKSQLSDLPAASL